MKHLEEMIAELGHDSAVLVLQGIAEGWNEHTNPNRMDLPAAADLLSRVFEVESYVILGKLDTAERELTSNTKFCTNVRNGKEEVFSHNGF